MLHGLRTGWAWQHLPLDLLRQRRGYRYFSTWRRLEPSPIKLAHGHSIRRR
ncbi:hypothetical protein FV242_22860 [Methylobacterium sp. WL64]|nr:hypothetical protein FV242_22860 [Methylobacterium sp. WL64]